MDAINNKDKLHKTIMVGGGLLLGLMALSWGVRFLSNASQQVKISEQEIQVIAPQEKTEPLMVGQSSHNQTVQKSQTELELSASYFQDMIAQSQKELIMARAKKWLIFATSEAPKSKQTEGEFLTQKLLTFVDEIRRLSNNGALDPSPESMDEYISLTTEAQAIVLAMTEYPQGGANNRVDVTKVLMGGNDFYMKSLALNNVQRFGAEEMLKPPVKSTNIEPDQVSPKAIEEEPIEEEEVNKDGNQ